jgi:DNA-binding XRE family transcriptional regulator
MTNTISKEDLAAQARAWRHQWMLSQKAAADLLGISQRTYEGIEQGRGFAYPSMLLAMLEMTQKDEGKK